MNRFFLVVAAFIFLSASSVSAKETQAEMKAMIAELYAIETKLGPEDTLRELIDRRNQIVGRFVEIGKPATPLLLEALNDTTRYGFVRRTAAAAIGKINDPAIDSSLRALLKNGNVSQRQGAAEALGNLKSRPSVKSLIQALVEDSQDNVRMLSAVALGGIGDKSAVNPLADRVRDRKENPNVRAYSAMALGELKATNKIKVILFIFEEEHQKAPGRSFAEHCEKALRLISKAKIDYYSASHISKKRQDKIVKDWRRWWESEGKLKYPQS